VNKNILKISSCGIELSFLLLLNIHLMPFFAGKGERERSFYLMAAAGVVAQLRTAHLNWFSSNIYVILSNRFSGVCVLNGL
jgi:hypothetical protein